MGKKGSWFSAIKRVFTHSSKEKVADGTEKKSSKEKKKKGREKHKHGEAHSFMPLFRGPSSIEKILGEAEREHQITNHRPPTPPEQPPKVLQPHATPPPPPPPRTATPLKAAASPRTSTPLSTASPPRDAARPTPPRARSPPPQRVPSPPRVATPVNAATPARVPSPRFVQQHRPQPTLSDQHICATKIQAVYRGYTARRSYRALRGLVRLQAVVKGQSVKRQTANALKSAQLLVRVQTQIQSRRIQMIENQALQRQALHRNNKDLDSIFGKWNLDDWDDSTLTKEEIEARMQRKFDAIVKRERAMAYAYSHQLWKATPKMAQSALMDLRSGGFPYWWNWLEQRQGPPVTPTNPSQSPAVKSFHLTPTRPTMDFKASPSPSPLPHSSNLEQSGHGFDSFDTPTRSTIPSRTKLARTPPGRLQQRFSRVNSPFNNGSAFRDDDSLTSCPPFSAPRYMSPTMSAKAKVRSGKEQVQTPDSPCSTYTDDQSKRRVSFPLGQDFKWGNKGPLFFNKETGSQKGLGKKNLSSAQSVGNMSVASSTVSMPATVGRKPFNRFV